LKRLYAFLASIIISFSISYVVFLINQGFRNSFEVCFNISLLLFINICFGFFAYFLIRDMFLNRWGKMSLKSELVSTRIGTLPNNVKLPEPDKLLLEKYLNPLENMSLLKKDPNYQRLFSNSEKSALGFELVHSNSQDKIEAKKELIIYLHGMKRNAKYIRFYTRALALDGTVVFTYNARTTLSETIQNGTEMGRVPNRGFLLREQDFSTILEFFLHHPLYKEYKINIIGESLGAITAVGVLFTPENKKYLDSIYRIILISLPSVFNKVLNRHLFPFSRPWIIRLNYIMAGIQIYPKEPLNSRLSPYSIFLQCKHDFQNQTPSKPWSHYINNKVFLIHSATDGIFKIRNFEENKEALELDSNNFVLFADGGHNQIRNEITIISIIKEFFGRSL
jgi:hypothetical protein